MSDFDYWHYQRFINSGKKRRHSQKWFKERCSYLGDDYELLDEYRGLQTPVTFYHKKCGHRWRVNPDAIVYKHVRCNWCHMHTEGLQRLQQFCKEHDLEIVEYKSTREPATFRAIKCNHIFTRRVHNLYKSWRCPYCNGYKQRGEVSKLGKDVHGWRKRHGITKDELRKMMHINSHTITDLERGYRQPTKGEERLFKYYMNALDRNER